MDADRPEEANRSAQRRLDRHGHSKGMAGAQGGVPQLIARLLARAKVEGDCWLWTGALTAGYPKFWTERGTARGHRWLYEQLHGPIPTGWSIDHLCRNRACVRPQHLEAVPHGLNLARAPYHAAQYSEDVRRRVVAEGEAAVARLRRSPANGSVR